MILLILGGRLQGTEAVYLANEAGYTTWIMDKDQNAPAAGLCERFFCMDILDRPSAFKIFEKADMVLPAMENKQVLEAACDYCRILEKVFLFDITSYEISSSKARSNALFDSLEIPMPGNYPACSYPVVIKPDGMSGSAGVIKAYSKEEGDAYFKSHAGERMLIQEFIEGPSYSLEVIGDGKNFYYPQVTEVFVDNDYDCKGIEAPAAIDQKLYLQMMEIGKKLAGSLKIKGIFDIEVIDHNGTLKILEIDARLPSQTPISVYHSTGINMVRMLVGLSVGLPLEEEAGKKCSCLYFQILYENGRVRQKGEHIMADCGRLKRIKGFFGADEAITDYEEGKKSWRAIIIITAQNRRILYEKCDEFLAQWDEPASL